MTERDVTPRFKADESKLSKEKAAIRKRIREGDSEFRTKNESVWRAAVLFFEGIGGNAEQHTHYSGGTFDHSIDYHSQSFAGWHDYGLLWETNKLTWYYDGNVVASTTTHIPTGEHYIILNYGLSAALSAELSPPIDVPNAMTVDWVEVKQFS